MGFLPITKEEMIRQGFDQMDFVCVTGDAYVDHPSFGMAIISRVLEKEGYRVGIVSQPQNPEDYMVFGEPRLAFMVSSGNIDSMVNHYTVAKRRRKEDLYTPGGAGGKRPDRAVNVYTKAIKKLYPNSVVVIGGVEASLRRFAHYDYWEDKVLPSILVTSGADIISFGMGERQTKQIARALDDTGTSKALRSIDGVCYLSNKEELPKDFAECSSFKKVSEDKKSYAKATAIQIENQDAVTGKILVQKQDEDLYLVQNKPQKILSRKELDEVWELPFEKAYHPSYEKLGGVPAIKEVEFSIMHNRGCFGHCNFCSIAYHQGRQVSSRSVDSVIKEAEEMTKMPNFKGYIHDVGGPSANFRYPSCKKQEKLGLCTNRECLGDKPCPNLQVDHTEYTELLRKLRQIKGIKKVFIRSGIRYDYLIMDKNKEFFNDLVKHHVSGQLKVAPEHFSPRVLDLMGKPHIELYKKFQKEYYELSKKAGKKQFLVPYLMSSHPGCTMKDAIDLAVFLKTNNIRPEQVQDFYPTPLTVSTCMYYTGINPKTMEEVYVPKDKEEKRKQRLLLEYYKKENQQQIIDILVENHKENLIGSGENCLVLPTAKYVREKREKEEKFKLSNKHSLRKNNKSPKKKAKGR